MQKKLVLITIILFGLTTVLTPVFAETVTCGQKGLSATSREAGGLLEGVSPCCVVHGQCGIGDFAITLYNIGKWIVGISAAIALAFITFSGGVLIFSGGNTGRIEQGKQMLRGSIIGLVIILTAWVLVNFIIASFVGSDGTIFDSGRPWNIIVR